ncbi:hypothetical protein AMS60_21645 [Bacillus sp. FJAT-21945]|nr:hypothetical protein AMS60_21645 [Bacillus sp. FJAT-21945]
MLKKVMWGKTKLKVIQIGKITVISAILISINEGFVTASDTYVLKVTSLLDKGALEMARHPYKKH